MMAVIKKVFYKGQIFKCNAEIKRIQKKSCLNECGALKDMNASVENMVAEIPGDVYLLAFWLRVKKSYETKLEDLTWKR